VHRRRARAGGTVDVDPRAGRITHRGTVARLAPRPAERDEGHALLDQPLGPRVALEGARQHDAVDLTALAQLPDPADLILGVGRGVDEHPESPRGRSLGEGVDEAVQHDSRDASRIRIQVDADGRAAPGAEAASGDGRRVAQLRDGRLDARTGRRADDVGCVEHIRHRLPRDSGDPRHIVDRGQSFGHRYHLLSAAHPP
jgi:hypothetical protein